MGGGAFFGMDQTYTTGGAVGVLFTVIIAAAHNPIVVSLCLSILAGIFAWRAIPLVGPVFVRSGLHGKDILKPDKPTIPESMGVIVGLAYFICLFLFIPVPFLEWFTSSDPNALPSFPHDKLGQYLGTILALFTMFFLGFADDVLDIRWRVKIWLPFIASLPLLTVYSVTYGVTTVVVPIPFRSYFATNTVDVGFIYYAYMSALCVFSTNAINILAGANGVEGAQSLVIAASIAIHNLFQIFTTPYTTTKEAHLFSLYFLLPFIGVTVAYLKHNWYPAKVFGGDTFCYFAGMTFAVVAIQGHFSKTVLLFMLPQIFNFLYSCPQLFHFVECPRHRMPKYNPTTRNVEVTRAPLKNLRLPGRLMLLFLELFGLADIRRDPATKQMVDVNNLTLMNLILTRLGPMREDHLVRNVVSVQIAGSVIAYIVRYQLVGLWYS